MVKPTLIAETVDYFVINKPAGYSVEPHDRYPSITDWLREHYGFKPIMNEANRWGIVHRLDVETSGVLIWAKTELAQIELQKLWQGRQVKKTYLALVAGETLAEGDIEVSLERDNRNDKQRVALLPSAKARPAITEYTRLAVGDSAKIENPNSKIYNLVSLLECHPITGRTHQIRVHLNYLGHPIIGDKLYGNKLSDRIAAELKLDRHWLHAASIILDGREFTALLPADLKSTLKLCGIAEPKLPPKPLVI